MTGHGQCVIGVVTVIDIGDAKFDFENCCRKGHVIVSTRVVPPEQSGRIQWSRRLARRQFESPPRHATMRQQWGTSMAQALIAYEDAVLSLVDAHDGRVAHSSRYERAEFIRSGRGERPS